MMTEADQPRVCNNFRCQLTRKGIRVDWFNLNVKAWYCYPCAQEKNREALQFQRKYGLNPEQVCINEQEYTYRVLSNSLTI